MPVTVQPNPGQHSSDVEHESKSVPQVGDGVRQRPPEHWPEQQSEPAEQGERSERQPPGGATGGFAAQQPVAAQDSESRNVVVGPRRRI